MRQRIIKFHSKEKQGKFSRGGANNQSVLKGLFINEVTKFLAALEVQMLVCVSVCVSITLATTILDY